MLVRLSYKDVLCCKAPIYHISRQSCHFAIRRASQKKPVSK